MSTPCAKPCYNTKFPTIDFGSQQQRYMRSIERDGDERCLLPLLAPMQACVRVWYAYVSSQQHFICYCYSGILIQLFLLINNITKCEGGHWGKTNQPKFFL